MSWKAGLWRLLGKDPVAAVVSFASGDEAAVRAMVEEVRQLLPGRRHLLVGLRPMGIAGVEDVVVAPGREYLEARRALRGLRVGMAPVLFDAQPSVLRGVAFALAPTRVLAYNARLERHHLHWRAPLASLLFWRGVPLDRIWLRPLWLWPWRKDRSVFPGGHRVVDGRRESTTRAKVCVLTPYLPYPLSHGGAVRLYNLLRQASVEFDIALYAFYEQPPKPEDLAPVTAFCARVVLVEKPRYREPRWASWRPPEVEEYRSPAMAEALAGRPAGVLQVEYTQLASYPGDVLVEHDITLDLYRQVHGRRQTIASWWDYFRWRRFERRALRRSPQVVVMSEKDAELAAHPRVRVIPNGVDLRRFQPTAEPEARRLLFIGSFRHFPNVVAFRFFLGEVWPRVKALFPEVELTVVAGPDPLLYWGERELPDAPGIRILGYVADVRPLYEESNVVLVPTLESAGTNVKVLEAMAMGRVVVSTPSGCAGLGLRHGCEIWIADGAAAFAAGVEDLLEHPEERKRLAEAALEVARRRYDWRAIAAGQRALWRELAGSPLAIRPGRASDLAAVGALQAQAPEAAQWNPRDYLDYEFLVAAQDGEVLGFVAFRRTAPDEGEILNLVVAAARRREGIGQRLLEAALAGMGGDVYLEVRASNAAALELYEQFGFRKMSVRPGYYGSLGTPASPETGIVMHYRKC